MSNAALEIHCTRTAWASRAGLTVLGCKKRVIFLSIFTLEHILCLLLSLIYPAVYLLNKDLFELSVSRYST